jgi:hypothetical protein
MDAFLAGIDYARATGDATAPETPGAITQSLKTNFGATDPLHGARMRDLKP